jgi:excisionase family DNA binding protein
MVDEKKVLTVEEAARQLGVCGALLRKEIKAGRVYAVRLGDRYLVPTSVVERLLNGGQCPPAPPCAPTGS